MGGIYGRGIGVLYRGLNLMHCMCVLVFYIEDETICTYVCLSVLY